MDGSMSIKCVTLRVRECMDMITINNQQRDLEIHTNSHIFNEDHLSVNHDVRIQLISYTNSFVSRYFTCPRFDHRHLHI
jgi:hypothetical protein